MEFTYLDKRNDSEATTDSLSLPLSLTHCTKILNIHKAVMLLCVQGRDMCSHKVSQCKR